MNRINKIKKLDPAFQILLILFILSNSFS
jgi:hypothetical protein